MTEILETYRSIDRRRKRIAALGATLSMLVALNTACSAKGSKEEEWIVDASCGDSEFKRDVGSENTAAFISTLIVKGDANEYGTISVNRSGIDTVVGTRQDDELPSKPEPISIIYEEPSKRVNELSLDLVGATWELEVTDSTITIDGKCD